MSTTPLRPEAGEQLPELRTRITREQLVQYAGASGDFNPIHYSDHHAKALGLDGVIGHGMLTMGIALRVVTDWCGDPARVVSHQFRFSSPVPVPDDSEGAEVIITGTVDKVSDDLTTISLVARCGETTVGKGKTEVRVD